MAAVLAAGKDAVLSHITAGGAWAMRPPGAGVIHVTVPGDPGRKRQQGIRIHRSRTLTPRTPRPPTSASPSPPPPAPSSTSPAPSTPSRSSKPSTKPTAAA
jgi:hypothetical protein